MRIITWYQKEGFPENPFSIKPIFDEQLFGFEEKMEELNSNLAQDNFYIVTGDYGNGKTTLLKVIIKKLRGNNLIYYNYLKNDREMDFEKLLTGMSVFRKAFKFKRKENTLLIDEAHEITKEDLKKIRDMLEQGYLKSVVLIAHDEKKILQKIKDKRGIKRIKMGKIGKDDAIALIRHRAGDLGLLSDDKVIVQILKKSKGVRDFLRNSEDVCRHAFRNGKDRVTTEIVKKVLG